MTSTMPNGTTGSTSSTGEASGGSVATTQEKISRVAEGAPAELSKVTQDVKTQVRESTRRTLHDVRSQADDQAARAAQGLRELSTRARALAEGRTEEAGNLGGMIENLGRQASDIAQRLETGGVQVLLDDASRFARKRPLTFLALAAGAGFFAGRLVRTGAEVASHDDSSDPRTGTMAAPFGESPVAKSQYAGVSA
jgi:ElaB/YqjD/DUF883 family membrane-anchored ribosome-binding protein